MQTFMAKIPTVDFEDLNKKVQKAYRGKKEQPIELFPRWTA